MLGTLTKLVVASAAAASMTLCAAAANAQDYPNKVVNLVVAYPAGGGVDAVGRIVANKLSDALGQQVIVVNKPGAGSVLGTRDVAKSAPDGYTLLLLVTGAGLPSNPGYDMEKDFAPISLIASVPIVVMANPSVPVKTMQDVIDLAKKEGDKLTVGTPPAPTLNYFGAEKFKAMTKTSITIVPFKGTGPLTNDLVGGHVMVAFNTLPPAIGNIQAGKIRAIAVGSPTPMAAIPDVPPISKTLPGLDIVQYYGLAAPAGTPQPIIDRLNKEMVKIVNSEDMKKRLQDQGGDAMSSTPAEYAKNIATEEGKWAAVMKELGIVVTY
ncbi:MAG: tripartite tricarboxylate transporter substrate binding protein [Pseudolabrys sp.]|nr:tripartite tricarboxylate transporter substrate binding protein [Pseudolabrys sp.]